MIAAFLGSFTGVMAAVALIARMEYKSYKK
jgi:uncharacterized membrane protein YtjA (UPF0391 family)